MIQSILAVTGIMNNLFLSALQVGLSLQPQWEAKRMAQNDGRNTCSLEISTEL